MILEVNKKSANGKNITNNLIYKGERYEKVTINYIVDNVSAIFVYR